MRLQGSTMRRRFDADSQRWRSASPEPVRLRSLAEARRLPDELTKRVEKALAVVYRAILPQILSRTSPGWGPGPLSTERNWEFFVQLGEELGEWALELARWQDPSGASIRRVERSHLEEAAGELVTVVRRMPTPVRTVVEARACHVSWRKISDEFPERAFFSMQEDWRRAVGTLGLDWEDVIRRLT